MLASRFAFCGLALASMTTRSVVGASCNSDNLSMARARRAGRFDELRANLADAYRQAGVYYPAGVSRASVGRLLATSGLVNRVEWSEVARHLLNLDDRTISVQMRSPPSVEPR